MKLSELLGENLKWASDLEARLLRRRRFSAFGFTAGLLGAIVQVAVFARDKDVAAVLGSWANGALLFVAGLIAWLAGAFQGRFDPPPQWAGLPMTELVGSLLVVAVLLWSWLLRWTRFLLKESQEPFRYTFGVEAFTPVPLTPGERFKLGDEDCLRLLHHDLRERLSQRIRRLSLQDAASPATSGESAGSDAATLPAGSHVQIGGAYALRQDRQGQWIVHVMPQVRVGSSGTAWTIAMPVRFALIAAPDATGALLGPVRYAQLVERLYSSVATEVYRAIDVDVRDKITLFPTAYLRAVALFHEAEDLARSNTIDAYERALLLYREALRHFDLAGGKQVVHGLLRRLPLAWRRAARVDSMRARMVVGYAKCMVYRRMLSTQSGRPTNTIFELRPLLGGVVARLEDLQGRLASGWLRRRLREPSAQASYGRFVAYFGFLTEPIDVWQRRLLLLPSQSFFAHQRRMLFDAYAAYGLAFAQLGAPRAALAQLDLAEALHPPLSQADPVYLLARAEAEPVIDAKVRLLARATEQAPDFQIVQFQLATWLEMRLRQQDQIDALHVNRVIEEYEKVLQINPGNVAALAAQGYLSWLVGDLDAAARHFEQGRELKEVVRQTFIGELNYGLARVAAERAQFDASHDRYLEAIAADPGVGAYALFAPGQPAAVSSFDGIGAGMLRRYAQFRSAVVGGSGAPGAAGGAGDSQVRKVVESFVLNDYGNACLNFFIRCGHSERAVEAVRVLGQAVDAFPNNLVAAYNLTAALDWRLGVDVEGDSGDHIEQRLDRIIERAPNWREPKVLRARIRAERLPERRQQLGDQAEAARHEHRGVLDQFEQSRTDLGRARRDEDLASSDADKSRAARKREHWLAEVARLDREARALDAKVLDFEQRIRKLAEEALDAVIECTTLAPLKSGFTIDAQGRGIEEVLSDPLIRWDRLDEFDAYALGHWAKVVSTTAADAAARRLAERLCEHLLARYSPENRDVLETSLFALGGKDDPPSSAAGQRRKALCDQVEDWCRFDPTSWNVLQWVRSWCQPDVSVACLLRAVAADPGGHALHALLADAYARSGRSGEARKQRECADRAQVTAYETALAADPGHPEISSGLAQALMRVAEALQNGGPDGERVAAMRQAATLLQQAALLAPQEPGYRRSADALQRRLALADFFDDRSVDHRLGIADRLGLVLSADLGPRAESGNAATLAERLEAWCVGLYASTGVRLQTPRTWYEEAGSPKGVAIIAIDRLERARLDGLSFERRLYRGPATDLKAHAVEAMEAIDPQTGAIGAWVQREHWATVEAAGLPLQDAAESIVGSLDTLVRGCLAEFVGHDEVMTWLEQPAPDEHARLGARPLELAALVAVLRGLVAERVSIRPLAVIAREFARRRALGDGVAEVIEGVRRLPEVRPGLPGNDGQQALLRPDPDLLTALAKAVRPFGRAAVPVLPFDRRDRLLESLQMAIDAAQAGAVVVSEASSRAHVAALVRTRWPQLPVLAEDELRPTLVQQLATRH